MRELKHKQKMRLLKLWKHYPLMVEFIKHYWKIYFSKRWRLLKMKQKRKTRKEIRKYDWGQYTFKFTD